MNRNSETNVMNAQHLEEIEKITSDLVNLLLSLNSHDQREKIADTIAALFEYTGNDDGFTYLVSRKLINICADGRTEAPYPFFLKCQNAPIYHHPSSDQVAASQATRGPAL